MNPNNVLIADLFAETVLAAFLLPTINMAETL